jgi:hypothetical protein
MNKFNKNISTNSKENGSYIQWLVEKLVRLSFFKNDILSIIKLEILNICFKSIIRILNNRILRSIQSRING